MYFLYRITSFDTHGKSMRSLFVEAFGKDCHFPFLKIAEPIDLIANEYLEIWQKITPNPYHGIRHGLLCNHSNPSSLQLKSRAASPCLDSRVTAFWSKDTNVSPPSQAPS